MSHRFHEQPGNFLAVTEALLYVPGERVRTTGVYEILHQGHRAAHEAFLWQDDAFPRCQQCGGSVIFRLVLPARAPVCEHVSADQDFSGGVTGGLEGNVRPRGMKK